MDSLPRREFSDDEMLDPEDVLEFCNDEGEWSESEDEETMPPGADDCGPEEEAPSTFDPPQDDAAKVLTGHKESVFSISIDATGTYLASGGQDHVAIIWDLKTGNMLFTIGGHEDSVTCVTFSPDGQFLATGDMAGSVQVWLRPSPTDTSTEWLLVHSAQVSDLSWLLWWQPPSMDSNTRPGKSPPAVLAAGDSDSVITLWSITGTMSKGTAKRAKYITGSGSPVIAALYHLPSCETNSPKLIALYQNAEIRLWDVRSEVLLASVQLGIDRRDDAPDVYQNDDSTVVFSLACPPSRPLYKDTCDRRELIAVGGAGVIHLVVCRQSEESTYVARNIVTLEIGDGASVEALDFCWTHPFFAFGTVEGTIGIVDSVKLRIRQKWTYTTETNSTSSIGVTALRWSHTRPIFFTATTHGAVTAWSGLTGSAAEMGSSPTAPAPLFTCWGHRAMLLDLALPPPTVRSSPDATAPSSSSCLQTIASETMEAFVASASDDATIRLFTVGDKIY